MKGMSQEFIDSSNALKQLLDDKDGRAISVKSLRIKFSCFKKEKDGTKCTMILEDRGNCEKCQLVISKSESIMLSRQKNYDFYVTYVADSVVIILILKQLIQGNNLQSILQYDEEERLWMMKTPQN